MGAVFGLPLPIFNGILSAAVMVLRPVQGRCKGVQRRGSCEAAYPTVQEAKRSGVYLPNRGKHCNFVEAGRLVELRLCDGVTACDKESP
jgi:hypothetical protein